MDRESNAENLKSLLYDVFINVHSCSKLPEQWPHVIHDGQCGSAYFGQLYCDANAHNWLLLNDAHLLFMLLVAAAHVNIRLKWFHVGHFLNSRQTGMSGGDSLMTSSISATVYGVEKKCIFATKKTTNVPLEQLNQSRVIELWTWHYWDMKYICDI